MTQVLVRNGIQAVGDGLTSLIIVGKKSVLKNVTFEGKFKEVAQKFVTGSVLVDYTNAMFFDFCPKLRYMVTFV